MTRTWRSFRLSSRNTVGKHFAGSVAILPTILFHPGKKDMSLGGVTERAVELRVLHVAVTLAWGGAWEACAKCGRAVNDQLTVRLGRMFQHVTCKTCSDIEEAEESAKFMADLEAGHVKIWPLCEDSDLSTDDD